MMSTDIRQSLKKREGKNTVHAYITRRAWNAIRKTALEAVEAIPETHNRRREHVLSDIIERELVKYIKYCTWEQSEGDAAIYIGSKNLGRSRKYSDWVKTFEETHIYKNDKRTNLIRIYR